MGEGVYPKCVYVLVNECVCECMCECVCECMCECVCECVIECVIECVCECVCVIEIEKSMYISKSLNAINLRIFISGIHVQKLDSWKKTQNCRDKFFFFGKKYFHSTQIFDVVFEYIM